MRSTFEPVDNQRCADIVRAFREAKGGFPSGLLLVDPPTQRRRVYLSSTKMLTLTQPDCLPADGGAVCISKTDYILWRACAKNAWLRIHRPDVYYSAELTDFERSVMAMGIEVSTSLVVYFQAAWPLLVHKPRG